MPEHGASVGEPMTAGEVTVRGGLHLDLAMQPSDALEVAERLRRIAELPQRTPADHRTAARLDYIAEALELAAAG